MAELLESIFWLILCRTSAETFCPHDIDTLPKLPKAIRNIFRGPCSVFYNLIVRLENKITWCCKKGYDIIVQRIKESVWLYLLSTDDVTTYSLKCHGVEFWEADRFSTNKYICKTWRKIASFHKNTELGNFLGKICLVNVLIHSACKFNLNLHF